MALLKITCPACKTVLKPPKPVPEGTKLKCPKCKSAFTAGAAVPSLSLDDEEPEQPLDEDGDDFRLVDDDAPKKKGGGIVETPEKPTAEKKQKAADEIDVIDLLDDDDEDTKKKKDRASPKEKTPAKKPEKTPAKKPEKTALEQEDDDSAGTYGVAGKEEEEALPTPPKKGKKGKKGKQEDKEEMSYAADLGGPDDPRGPAQEEVMVCSNYMLLSAIIGFIGWGGVLILVLIPKLFPLGADDGTKDNLKPVLNMPYQVLGAIVQTGELPRQKDERAKEKGSIFTVGPVDMAAFAQFGTLLYLAVLSPILLGMAWAALVAYGAAEAQSLNSRAWGIAGSILCMLAWHIVGFALLVLWIVEVLLLGMLEMDKPTVYYTEIGLLIMFIVAELAVGAWVLVTLLKDKVKAGYEYKPE